MPNSITISGLNELTYVTGDDFLAFVDSGSLTTFRVSVNTLKNYFASSGSVLSASFASQSISASYTVNADTASYLYPRLYLMTASWASNVDPTTVVGTASLAYNARTSSHLEGVGSSYENTFIVNTWLAPTGSAYIAIPRRVRMFSVAGNLTSVKSGSLFLNKDYVPGTNGYGKAYFFDDNLQRGKFVFEVGDSYTAVNTIGPNIDAITSNSKGFLFQSNEAGNVNNLGRTGSLLFISGSGRTYGRIFEAKEFSSSLTTTGQVGFYGTASYAIGADFSLGSANVIPTGMIVGFAASASQTPMGWLNCDGSVYNTSSYSNLTALIGTNYGPALTINRYIVAETITTYHNAANGSVKITWVSGGSGLFSLAWGASTYYINATTDTNVTISGLSGPVNYNYTFTDLGFTPVVAYPLVATVPYGGAASSTNLVLSAASYRLPRISTSYFQTYTTLNPLIWIIKT